MPLPDKSPRRSTGAFSAIPALRKLAQLFLTAIVITGVSACNRMVTPQATQTLKDAEAKVSSGDMLEAITLYESALNNSARSADIHYRLAVLYDDKLSDPLNAMHHFKRYLTLAPTGSKAAEVKNLMKRDEISLLTSLSGDSLATRAEAARLRNENLNLRKELEERAALLKSATAHEKSGRNSRTEKSPAPKKRKPAG